VQNIKIFDFYEFIMTESEKQETIIENPTLTQSAVTDVVGFDAKSWVEKNLTLIIGVVAGVAVLIGGYVWFSKSSAENEELASLALSRVKSYYETGDYQKALAGDPTKTVRGEQIVGLQAIVDEYGGTNAGKVASLYAGNALLALNKASEAESYFDKASGSSSDIVAVGGKSGIAACKEQSGDYQSAASMYEGILSQAEKTGSKDRTLLMAGLNYEKAGNKEKAEKMYRDLLAEFENSEFVGEAKSGLVRIGTVVDR
jgi:tetratricopeptide (TPR) repeat protein